MSSNNDTRNRHEIEIRNMEIDDLSAVYHLGERLFTSEGYPILYRTWDPYEVTDAFTSDPNYCYVAELEDKGDIVGFALATTIEKEGTAWKKYGYVSWIGVDGQFQRSNLGQRLYRRLEERFRKDGVRMIIADTDEDNKGAIAFFKSMEFSHSSNHVWLTKTLRKPVKNKDK
jgi:ribosomal protein S18 acetylase RimI-like enzyme